MGSNYRDRMNYEVDLVFCIDATMSMDPVLDKVKKNALNFYQDFQNRMDEKGKKVDQLRVRVVAFRDYSYDDKPMMVTNFFKLPDMEKQFEECIKSIVLQGGGDDLEDGLEALAFAMKSDWCNSGVAKKRHVIVVWSDDGTHELGFGKKDIHYPKNMAKDFNELTQMWGSKQSPGVMNENAKRLLIFAPDKPGWSLVRDNWNNVIHAIVDDTDVGLASVEYTQILDAICSSV